MGHFLVVFRIVTDPSVLRLLKSADPVFKTDLARNGLGSGKSLRVSAINNVFLARLGKLVLYFRDLAHIRHEPRLGAIGNIKVA